MHPFQALAAPRRPSAQPRLLLLLYHCHFFVMILRVYFVIIIYIAAAARLRRRPGRVRCARAGRAAAAAAAGGVPGRHQPPGDARDGGRQQELCAALHRNAALLRVRACVSACICAYVCACVHACMRCWLHKTWSRALRRRAGPALTPARLRGASQVKLFMDGQPERFSLPAPLASALGMHTGSRMGVAEVRVRVHACVGVWVWMWVCVGGWVSGWGCRCVDGWVSKCVGGWVIKCVGGWVGVRMCASGSASLPACAHEASIV